MPDQADGSGERADALRAEIAKLRVKGGTVARERALARAGAALMVAGVAVSLWAYQLSFNADVDAQQRDAIVLALAGLAVVVAGAAVYLRYSLGQLLRFWLARLLAERDRQPKQR